MKHVKRLFILFLSFAILMTSSTVSMAASNTATKSGLSKRMQKLPGEPSYYDPDTGVYFNPLNGNIEKFKTQYKRLPGEPLYYKVGAGKKYFDPSIYSQFITSKSVKLTAYKDSESSSGFTLYLGPALDLGGGIGGGVSGGLALSYNKSKKSWTLSLWGSGSVSSVAGLDNQAGFTVGYVDGDETALKGWCGNVSGNVPIGDISVSASGSNIGISFKVAPGPSAGASGGASYTVTKTIVTTRKFFK